VAVNAETGKLDARMGPRMMEPGGRPTSNDLVRVGPGGWIADYEPVPRLPLQQAQQTW